MKYEIWYLTHPGLLYLKEVAITRSTDSSVWELVPALFEDQSDTEKKQKRHSHYSDYWPTLQEAAEKLRKQAEKAYQKAKEELDKSESILNGIYQGKVRVFPWLKTSKLKYGEELILE